MSDTIIDIICEHMEKELKGKVGSSKHPVTWDVGYFGEPGQKWLVIESVTDMRLSKYKLKIEFFHNHISISLKKGILRVWDDFIDRGTVSAGDPEMMQKLMELVAK